MALAGANLAVDPYGSARTADETVTETTIHGVAALVLELAPVVQENMGVALVVSSCQKLGQHNEELLQFSHRGLADPSRGVLSQAV